MNYNKYFFRTENNIVLIDLTVKNRYRSRKLTKIQYKKTFATQKKL